MAPPRNAMTVKLLDLVPQYESIKEEIREAIDEVLSTQQFILGKKVEALEAEIARYCGVRWAAGVASGSDAILLALMALGIGPGDEVVTTPYTFFSTVSSITRLGATPVFADIDPRTYNIDPAQVSRRITGKTRAIILDHCGNYSLHGHVLAERRWSLNSQRRDPRKEKPPITTSCPQCYGVWPGTPRECPSCGYEWKEAPDRKFKPFKTIEGELVEAMPDLPPQDAASMAAFLTRMQHVDAKTKQRALLGMAFELAPGGEEGKRRLALLSKAVGNKPTWVDWAVRFTEKKKET